MTRAAAQPLVRAAGLAVGYGAAVCPPLTFTVRAGQVLAVVGANGTGKSTLLRTVAGQLEPVKGRVEVLGRPVDERSAEFRAAVAADLGDDVFFPALTAREHLLLTCLGHGVAEAPDVVEDLLEEFGLTARADALPQALSSGQRRRLLLAAAFSRPRSLLLLDEPEQRLDTRMRAHLAGRLVEERESGGAVLLATHDPGLVARVATAVLLITEEAVRLLAAADGADAVARL
ncbi:ABC transporter ATP-binding protein [Georgenia ruanii]|uniref:ATP-binding cassette domain-containing protein n=1 Tax=Georgenia ruanii TaxID=348442 RepID=A0A7J9UXU6_9MICO|nr:ABC transporter ATP-binding protein [Georgenia ruanii]MPV89447.1 ATP-binding cassette domain-containing protein [Georgenia ruanii]